MGASLRETGSRASHRASKAVSTKGFDPARKALIAFWKADGAFQRADNLRMGLPMDAVDLRTLEAIQAAQAA